MRCRCTAQRKGRPYACCPLANATDLLTPVLWTMAGGWVKTTVLFFAVCGPKFTRFRRYSRSKWEVARNRAKNMFFGPPTFLGEDPKFWTFQCTQQIVTIIIYVELLSLVSVSEPMTNFTQCHAIAGPTFNCEWTEQSHRRSFIVLVFHYKRAVIMLWFINRDGKCHDFFLTDIFTDNFVESFAKVSLFIMVVRLPCWPTAVLFYRCRLDLL